jgi:hypothetical protein
LVIEIIIIIKLTYIKNISYTAKHCYPAMKMNWHDPNGARKGRFGVGPEKGGPAPERADYLRFRDSSKVKKLLEGKFNG